MTYTFTPEQEAWLRDLETTTEPQTQGYLHIKKPLKKVGGKMIPEGFCCLGRACKVFNVPEAAGSEDKLDDGIDVGDAVVSYVDRHSGRIWGCLPSQLVKTLRLRCNSGSLLSPESGWNTLTELNDNGWTFKAIAAYIRANPENVFLPPED